MCLAVPAKLVSRSGMAGVADLHGNRVQISTVLVPEAVEGDWVLVHAGFAIQRVSDEDVQKTWEVLKDMERAHQQATSAPETTAKPQAAGRST